MNHQNRKNTFTRRQLLRTAGLITGGVAASSIFSACNVVGAKGPVKIGLLLPYTAGYAALGVSIEQGMRMYFDEIGNEAGGRKLEIITADEGSTPDEATPKAKKLVEQDNVDIMSGIVSSGVLGALRNYFDTNQKLLLCSNAGVNTVSRKAKTPYIWRTSFTNWQPNWPVGAWAAKNIGKKAIISVPDYAAGADTITSFSNSFKAAGGEIVLTQKTPFPNIGDPAPFITEIAKTNADFLYCFYSGGQAVTFSKAYSEFGLQGKLPLLCSGFMVEEDVLPATGKFALGARSGLHWALYLDNPENKKFVEAYKKKYNKTADVFAVQGYDTGRVIAEALKATQGDSTAKKLIDVLPGIKFASPRGAFAFDTNTQNPTNNIYMREVKEIDGGPHNVVLANLGPTPDPGDDSKG